MSSELAVITPKSIEEAERLSKTLSVSQLLPDALKQRPQDVLAIVLTGAELGLAPMQAIRGIQVIKGKPTLAAETMGALVRRRSDVCEYLTLKASDATRATYETKRRGDPSATTMSFTIEEAKNAGLLGNDNWRKYPAAMLRARCLSAICKAMYSDLVLGLYDPDELADAPSALPPAPVERDVTPVAPAKNAAEAKARLAAVVGQINGHAKVEDAQVVEAKPAHRLTIVDQATPSPWELIKKAGADAGMNQKDIGAKLKELTGKSKLSELTPEDAATFQSWVDDVPPPPSESTQQAEEAIPF